MSSRRAIRDELLHFLSADKDGNPANLPDPPPPLEDGSNQLFSLLSRASQMPLTKKTSEESHAFYELLPLFLLRILGYRTGSGWLETGSDLPHRDREGLLRLIMPDGPIHNFCRLHDPSNVQNDFTSSDFKYEFPVSNLPDITWNALNNPSYASSLPLESQSALAHLLRGALRETDSTMLLLSPMQYFELCLVSSAAKKSTDVLRITSKSRRQKRSSSLPSVRALYNKVIAAYAGLHSTSTRMESTPSLLISACIDMFCLPWVESVYSVGCPRPSTPSVDALSSVLLTITPKSKSEARLLDKPNSSLIWAELTQGEALYRAVEIVLREVFQHYNTKESGSTFIAYVRLFALYLAPWKKSIRLTMQTGLYPKKRTSASSGKRSIKSTLNSINEQIKYASGVSPRNTEQFSADVLKDWRERLYSDRKERDSTLLLHCIIRAANQRVASVSDGCRALALVAEAVTTANLMYEQNEGSDEKERRLEAEGCLVALREQTHEAEARMGMKTKPFVSTLAKYLRIKLEDNTSLFSVSRVAEKLTGVATSSSVNSGSEISRLVQRRRTTMLRQSLHERVDFEGSVWEQPITASENAYLIFGAYWLSLKLEPYLGFPPNTRLLGQPAVWRLVLVALVLIFCLRKLMFVLVW